MLHFCYNLLHFVTMLIINDLTNYFKIILCQSNFLVIFAPMETTIADISEGFRTLIEREDICSTDEFLHHQGQISESEWRKSHEESWAALCGYIERRRAYKIKVLEKLLINGEATATQVRCYETLVNGKSNDDVRQSSDEVLKLYNDIYGDNSST